MAFSARIMKGGAKSLEKLYQNLLEKVNILNIYQNKKSGGK